MPVPLNMLQNEPHLNGDMHNSNHQGSLSPRLGRKFKHGVPGARVSLQSGNFVHDFSKILDYIIKSIRARSRRQSLEGSDLVALDSSEVERGTGFLKHLTSQKEFVALLQLHKILSEHRLKESAPIVTDLTDLIEYVCDHLQEDIKKINRAAPLCQELLGILLNTHFQALISCHDIVANRRFVAQLDELLGAPEEYEAEEDGGLAVKIVRLIKNNEPLGATIKRAETTGDIVISRIICGGVADRSGCIHVGDRIIEVNGVLLRDMRPEDVVKLLGSSDSGSVSFKLIPGPFDDQLKSLNAAPTSLGNSEDSLFGAATLSALTDPLAGGRKLFVRALFDYDAKSDGVSPCPEAGISFKAGEILEILNQDDRHWWQARRYVTEGEAKTGLVPSATLQERKELFVRSSQTSPRSPKSPGSPSTTPRSKLRNFSLSGATSSLRRHKTSTSSHKAPGSPVNRPFSPISYFNTPIALRKASQNKKSTTTPPSAYPQMYEVRGCDDFDHLECRTYEEVALLYPRPNLHRPIVLVGAPGVGRNELKRRLLLVDAEKFATTVPYTSRSQRLGEVDGVDYCFETRENMELWIRQGRFIEYGEYKGNLYGTLIDSILELMEAEGRTCILNPHPQALRMVRRSQLQPFFILIKPPPFPALKESRCSTTQARSTFSTPQYTRGFTDEELLQMIEGTQKLEASYGHWFDYRLINGNLEVAFRELCDVIKSVEIDPHWVPVQWVK